MSDIAPDRRIPSLDGLRAISIGLVLVFHAVHGLAPAWPSHVLALFSMGGLGVRVFFVISGFLITQLLVAERSERGRINLARFCFRRTMRIFPPFYVYLAIVLILRAAGAVDTPTSAVVHAATYTTNYLSSSWNVGHSWSLSVEEQFYLLWPAIMILLGPKRWMWGAGLILVISPVMRTWLPSPISAARLDLVADSLAAGCLLTGFRSRLLESPRLSSWMRSGWTGAGVTLTIFAIEIATPHSTIVPGWLTSLVLISAQNVLIALVIHWCILNHHSAAGRVLNSAPMTFIGVLSYSLYLWQQPFFNPHLASPLTSFPVNLCAATACAVLSYYIVERPALALRRRLDGSRRRAAADRVVPSYIT